MHSAKPASDEHTADKDTIRQLDAQWGEAASSKQLDKTVSFYAADGTLVWPEQPPVHGTAGIRTNWQAMFDQYKTLNLVFTPESIDISRAGDLAVDFGKVEFNGSVAKYVVIWKKVEGDWKVLYDSWNTNQPAAPGQ